MERFPAIFTVIVGVGWLRTGALLIWIDNFPTLSLTRKFLEKREFLRGVKSPLKMLEISHPFQVGIESFKR